MNLYHYFKSSVLRVPHKTALCFEDRRFTYEELDLRVRRLAQVMKGFGIGPGGRVGLLCSNSNAYVEIVLAACMLGAVTRHFNWRISGRELKSLAGESPCQVLFFSMDHMPLIQELRGSLDSPPELVLTDARAQGFLSYEDLIEKAAPLKAMAELSYDDPAFIFYTSGTTSRPKGVILSVGSYYQHQITVMYEVGWREDDVFLQSLPLFHTSCSGVYCTLMCGGTVIILPRFDIEQWLRTAKQEHVTGAGLVPNVIGWLCSSPDFTRESLPWLRWIIYAGAPIPMPVLKRAAERVGNVFVQLYGMTEMCPTIAILTPNDHQNFLTSGQSFVPNGRPLTGIWLQVIDDNEQPCPPGVPGEITAKGYTMMTGYEGQPELTARVLRNGWYHTGDLGYLDENGYLYLTGRKNRMIITGGENVYPSQVENCIQKMGSRVKEAAVFGVPDAKWGEAVSALIVLSPGCSLDEAAVLEHCRRHLPCYMKPRHIRFVDELPRNENGKVDYPILKDYILPGEKNV